MAIAFVAASSYRGGSETVTLSVPTGTADDDVLVALIYAHTETCTTPTGWTLIQHTTSGSIHFYTFYRVAASEPVSYVFTLSAWQTHSGVMAAYRGVDTAAPVNVFGSTPGADANDPVSPSVTTTVDNCVIVRAGAINEGEASWTATPATDRITQLVVPADILADELLATAGNSGARTLNRSGGSVTYYCAFSVALAPAVSGATLTPAAVVLAPTFLAPQLNRIVGQAALALAPTFPAPTVKVTIYYLDWVSGNDTTGDGSSAAPWQTMTKFLSVAQSGDTCKLRGSDVSAEWYRERALTISVTNVTIEADTGHTPVIVGSTLHAAAGWSKTGGYTNVYESADTAPVCWAVWDGTTKLSLAASLAACDAAPDSYYFDAAGDKLYINVGGVPGDIEAADDANTPTLTASASGLTLGGLEYRYMMRALYLDAAGCTVANCTYSLWVAYTPYGGDYGIIFVRAAGAVVDTCDLTGNSNVGILAGAGAETLMVTDSVFLACVWGVELAAGSNHIVRDCTFTSCADAVNVEVNAVSATVTRCVAINGSHSGFRVAGSATLMCLYCVVYGVAPSAGMWGYVNDPTGILYCYHCIAYGVTSGCWICQSDGDSTVENCIAMNGAAYGFYANPAYANPGTRDYNCAYGNVNNYVLGWPQGAHEIVGDPLFVSPPADFVLSSGSPCIDTGVNVAGVDDGFLGTAPDIGRWETSPAVSGGGGPVIGSRIVRGE